MAKEIVYEVRCHQCQTSFAPETRRCIHCGMPLEKGRQVVAAAEAFEPDPAADEAEPLTRGPKAAIWVVMAVLTAIASVLRSCVD